MSEPRSRSGSPPTPGRTTPPPGPEEESFNPELSDSTLARMTGRPPRYLGSVDPPSYDESRASYRMGSVSFWSADSAQQIRHRSVLELENEHAWRKTMNLLPIPEHAMGIVVVGLRVDRPDFLRWNLARRTGPRSVCCRPSGGDPLTTMGVVSFIETHGASNPICFYVCWDSSVYGVGGEKPQDPPLLNPFIGPHNSPHTGAYPNEDLNVRASYHGDRYRIGSISPSSPRIQQRLALRTGIELSRDHSTNAVMFMSRPIPSEAMGVAIVDRSGDGLVWHVARKDSRDPRVVHFRRPGPQPRTQPGSIKQFLLMTGPPLFWSRDHYYIYWDQAYGNAEQPVWTPTAVQPPLVGTHTRAQPMPRVRLAP